ncbi:MAG: glycosyltransferase family 4 protein [Candidatus Schekmanbacteria bacterium]|nr:glycosyltransferase family 4 protein [Candidatus Schekmanbacteria bacterium]
MSKIAVVDLLFHWPPDGGSRIDLKEVFSRVAQKHEVKFFVPEFMRYYPRGEILTPFNDSIELELIRFNAITYNFYHVPTRIKKVVDKFKPDYVFVADGELIKPYVIDALREYKPILRYYSYDSFCIKDYGTFFHNGKVCNRCYLDTPLYCINCSLAWILKYRARMASHTFLTSLAFTPLLYRTIKRGLASASAIIVYNNYIAEIVKRFNPECLVVPSGVDIERFSPVSGKERKGKFKVLMAGRVDDPGKGFDILYRACKKLIAMGRDIELVITGEKKVRDEFVRSAGWLTPDEMPGLYNECDISVVPSIWMEPFGMVAVESLACGIPLIATRTGGLQNIIEECKNGFLVAPGDVDELASAIDRFISDRGLLEKMSVAARKSSEDRYDWDKIVSQVYMPLFE